MAPAAHPLEAYLHDARSLVLQELTQQLPPDTVWTGRLYERMLDYPMRAAKALRPALCIASCRALGGALGSVLPTAASLELFHNAFLIHDDVEDGSELRRGAPTLSRDLGVPIAVNVGDGMLAMALRPLLGNARVLGVQRGLMLMERVVEMAQRSAEGQALELEWIRTGSWAVSERDYLRMVYLKTAFYSFITPVRCGAIAANQAAKELGLSRFAALLGIAFQIQDDVLNLQSRPKYGKEEAGDLWEGKRTLILLHALRHMSEATRARAVAVLNLSREQKREEDISFLREQIQSHRSLEYARDIALQHAARARRLLRKEFGEGEDVHRLFLTDLVNYVVGRDW